VLVRTSKEVEEACNRQDTIVELPDQLLLLAQPIGVGGMRGFRGGFKLFIKICQLGVVFRL
jgi:hypothetical protein